MSSAGSSYKWALCDLLLTQNIYRISENKYITKNGLRKYGINDNYLKEFTKKIIDFFNDEDIFNIYMLLNKKIISDEDLKIGVIFIESLFQYSKDLKMIKIEKNNLFVKSKKNHTKSDFISYLIEKNYPLTSIQLCDIIKNEYGFFIDKYEIRYLIDKKKFYRNIETDEIKKHIDK